MKSNYFPQLDGLRGWASVMVVLNHLWPFFLFRTGGPSGDAVHALIHHGDPISYLTFGLASLAMIIYRFVSDGEIAVYVFFVLSGFVLANLYMKTRTNAVIWDQVLRRYFRLTLPIAAASLLAFMMVRSGMMQNISAGHALGNDWITAFYTQIPTLGDWFRQSFYNVYVHFDGANSLLFVLWTMQYEMGGSAIIFLTLALMGAWRSRWVCYAVLFVGTIVIDNHMTSFIVGMVLADLWTFNRFRDLVKGKWVKIALGVLMVPVVLSPNFLFHHVPRGVAPLVVTGIATVIVLATLSYASWERFLSNTVSQYLGKISFSLYLTHPLVLCSLSSYEVLLSLGPIDSPMYFHVTVITIAASLAVAHMFRPIDQGAVQFSRMFSKWVRKGSEPIGKKA